ncbi:MAG: hypothetical protein PHE83_02435 [Opitutaceae bacterium]|nr:hypothetical protein [Opitutaceae bacterium]
MRSPASGGSACSWPVESLRLGLLTGFAFWLAHPFLTGRLIGGGDAWWYANMLRDFLAQIRAGIFPVWTGQTEFAFNGAVYPLRAAPYYQFLAGLIDLLSGRRFDAFTLQHATVVLSFVAAVMIPYWALCRLAPARRNLAAVLAVLYAACPAVLGLATSMDLYMSVMAAPFLPLVTCGLALSLKEGESVSPELCKNEGGLVSSKPKRGEDGLVSPELCKSGGGWSAQRMIVIGLALTWYAHAPLAAWLTLITVGVQAVRLILNWRNRQVWQETFGGALLLAGLVAVVFASVATLRSGDSAGIIPYAIDREKIIAALREAFPYCLLPVRMPAVNLGDLQLGYALWTVLGAGGVFALTPGRRRYLLLAIPAAVLVVMLLPVPGVTVWLWHAIPESLARLTYYWPMHRLCPLLAALALPLGMLALREWLGPGRQGNGAAVLPFCRSDSLFLRSLPLALGILALPWSMYEARTMLATAKIRTATSQETAIKRLPENAPLMNHAYGLSLALPPYFSNGVMDPWFELRVLGGPGNQDVIADNARAVMAGSTLPWTDLATLPDPNPGVWDLASAFVLQPGRRHLLEFDFAGAHYTGTLQIEGGRFFRQYRLPASGRRLAFGSAPPSAHWIPLWTTSDRPESVRARFIPDPGTTTNRPPVFARYRWHAVDPPSLPLRIDSYAPLRLTATLVQSGLLETFRMYFPGYEAKVDGRPAPVVPSGNRLVAIPLPAGTHTIEISYRPPWLLQLALVVSAAAWLGLATFVLRRHMSWR